MPSLSRRPDSNCTLLITLPSLATRICSSHGPSNGTESQIIGVLKNAINHDRTTFTPSVNLDQQPLLANADSGRVTLSMMIIGKYGQLGNRLFPSINRCGREYGVKLMNPAFAEYAERFRSDLWCHYPELEASAGSPRWLTTLLTKSERNLVSKTVEWSGRGIHYLGGEIRA